MFHSNKGSLKYAKVDDCGNGNADSPTTEPTTQQTTMQTTGDQDQNGKIYMRLTVFVMIFAIVIIF